MNSAFGISREFGLGASMSASIGSGPDHLNAVAKIGVFRTVLGRHLTQAPLKSLSFPAAFQADDEGSIPFTRSNLFNGLDGVSLGIVSSQAVALCHGAVISD